ncbi:hypothetical protein, partial [Actibacterium sp. XHP0104]|uniref:hypothetical protein n=1 Tax=Actibacterium sp. XHP0104 TaxID=2984335 RepID=UPI0021E7D413
IKTSTCRNFETISSGFGRLFAILSPPFPKHNGGPVQMGRLTVKEQIWPTVADGIGQDILDRLSN